MNKDVLGFVTFAWKAPNRQCLNVSAPSLSPSHKSFQKNGFIFQPER